jgi:Carboxypeptidase regulatory-like domain
MRNLLGASSLSVCALLFGSVAFAQTDASVSGTVTDPTGAHIVAAIVTALNTNTGIATPATTNEAGIYTMPSLLPGKYTFSVEHPGFRKSVTNDVELQVGTVLTMNLGLELGSTTESVEVKAVATEVNATSASVGSVVEGKRLLDLPLAGRSAYDLLLTQPGVQSGTNFYLNGNQGGAVNFTMDGINAQNNLLSGSFYLYSNVVSVDRAEEFRVVTSPADAEYGRGSGQVQMVTRGGGNAFHGSAYYEVRNGAFNANNFINNALGKDANGHEIAKRDQLKQNTYGTRLGGPIKKNKAFFNGIWEPYKQRNNATTTATVYTAQARQGIFRFFPGVQNANNSAAVPTVDASGNPIQPATATGGLQSVSVLGRDPNRLVLDPTGDMGRTLAFMPLPNTFRTGDGLNTAGFTWNRPVPVNFELYEGRVDYIFNEKHRATVTANHQSYHSFNVAAPPPYPAVPGQADPTETTQYSLAVTSILKPTLLNDIRIGAFRPRTIVQVPWEVGQSPLTGSDADRKNLLQTAGGIQFVTNLAGATSPAAGQPSNYIAPVYQWGDDLTYIRGKHSFKVGFVTRWISDSGYDANNQTARVQIGAPTSAPVTNISTGANPITGIGANATTANNLLFDLTGSVSGTTGAFQTNYSPGGPNPYFLPGETRFREWHQNEWSWYFKDDWKVTPSLTLNLGIRWELYQRPTEGQGKMVAPVGGGAALFGISGTTFANGEFQPGVLNGSPTAVQLIGPGTTHPDVGIFNTDKNNFAPALGLAYAVPGEGMWKWLSGGKNKMTIRMGYGIGYQRLPIYLTHNNAGLEPGLAETDTAFPLNLSALTLPVPPAGVPLALVPQVGGASHTQTLFAFDQGIRTPYAQNYNFTITRALTQGITLNIAYVGSKGTKLARSINTNEVNIFENGILDAFKIVQAGGSSPLIDKIFNTSYAAVAAAGSGSNYVRTNSATTSFFANNNPGGFANFISTTNQLTGVLGGLLPAAGLANNFVVANPQYLATYLVGNYGNSTYNSLQVELNKRFSKGFTAQGSYVWSHNLGDSEGDSSTLQDSFRTLRNESIDKRPLSFDYQSVLKMNGLYELPFGKGKPLFGNASGLMDRFIGGWQIGAVALLYSGQPLEITGANTYNTSLSSYGFGANLVGALPTVGVQRTGSSVVYLGGFTQITDPAVANINSSTLRALSGLRAIADANGAPIFVNALPGQLGNVSYGLIRGPGSKSVNLNVIKHIKINEKVTAQIGATAQNATNTPIFAPPTAANLSIDSTTFGRITSATGSRLLVLQGRFTF